MFDIPPIRPAYRGNISFAGSFILHRLAGLDEGQFHAMLIGPAVEVFASKLGAIVEHDARWAASLGDQSIQARATRAPQIEVSTSIARHSLLKSSTTLNVLILRPSDS